MSRVWILNLGALPTLVSFSLKHIPCLFAYFYESVPCVYAFFSTCVSTCVARAACFVFDWSSVLITTFLFSFFFLYKFDRHLCYGAYSWTHKPAYMPRLLSYMHLPFNNSCVRVSEHVYAFPSLSISIHTYCHTICMFCVVLYSQPPFCFLFLVPQI